MAQRIVILKRAEQKIRKVYAYLFENWSEKVADEFYDKFERTAKTISLHPEIGQRSSKQPNVRRKLITKHNCLYYRIKNDSVIIINIKDTRQNPERNPYE